MNSLGKLVMSLGAVLFGVSLGSISVADDSTSSPAPEPGIWQKHEYTFRFLGFTSTYSCDGLADQLRVLLIAAGARRDSKSRAGVCASGYGRPDRLPQANLTFYTLTPVGGAGDAGGPRVPGTWRPVMIATRMPRELTLGDCEVVEQFRTLVLPMFTVRNIDDHTTCVPHQESGSVINLKFETFTEPPPKPVTGK
ncbi:MAG TPA: hypothetical protein VK794_12400 [Steroidobacteraceae bacterium]|jgi:hypothetical protein|nr:hypothetical protein [Steroidobacteraceae bacterium]